MKIFPYVTVSPWPWWVFMWRRRQFVGLFRNRPGVVKWIPDKLLPRRWGFYILGFEVGDRGRCSPGDWTTQPFGPGMFRALARQWFLRGKR